MNAGEHQNAPSLAGIVWRDVGATTYSGYSDALRQSRRIWDAALLEEFLADPDTLFKGTVMPKVEMSGETRKEIVSILTGLSQDIELR